MIAVVAPKQARRPPLGEERRLDGERPAAAHGVDERGPAVPARRQDHRGGKTLLHRRREGNLPVAPPGERLSRGVQVHRHLISLPVDMHHGPVPVGTGIGAQAAPFRQPVDNGVLGLLVDEAAVLDRRVVRRRGDREVGVGSARVEERLPGDLAEACVEAVRIVRGKGRQVEEDPVTRPEMEVQPHRVAERPFRFNGRFPFPEDGKIQGADLPGEPGDDPLRAGDDDLLFFSPRVCEHFGLLAQPCGNAKKRVWETRPDRAIRPRVHLPLTSPGAFTISSPSDPERKGPGTGVHFQAHLQS